MLSSMWDLNSSIPRDWTHAFCSRSAESLGNSPLLPFCLMSLLTLCSWRPTYWSSRSQKRGVLKINCDSRLQTPKKLKIRSFFKVKSSLLRKNNQIHKRTWQPLSQTSAPSPRGSETTRSWGLFRPSAPPPSNFFNPTTFSDF